MWAGAIHGVNPVIPLSANFRYTDTLSKAFNDGRASDVALAKLSARA